MPLVASLAWCLLHLNYRVASDHAAQGSGTVASDLVQPQMHPAGSEPCVCANKYQTLTGPASGLIVTATCAVPGMSFR